MDKRTKMILSAIGIAAIVIPLLLLILMTAKPKKEPQVSEESRSVDTKNIEETVKKIPPKTPQFPVESPATSSAESTEGSPSAQ